MRRKFYTVLRAEKKTLTIVPENTPMVVLQDAGTMPPFFMIDSYPYFIDVVKLLGHDQPIISLIGHEDMLLAGHYTIEDEAARHIQTILELQPTGPYLLGGCSASGVVAYEIAQQMGVRGLEVDLLVLFDVTNPYYMREYSALWRSLNSYRADLHRLRVREIPLWITKKLKNRMLKTAGWLQKGPLGAGVYQHQLGPSETRIQLARKYHPAPYSGKVLLFKRHRELTGRYRDPQFGWGSTIRGDLEICQMSATDHLEIFKSECGRTLVARKLRDRIDEIVGRLSSRRESRKRGRGSEGRTG